MKLFTNLQQFSKHAP